MPNEPTMIFYDIIELQTFLINKKAVDDIELNLSETTIDTNTLIALSAFLQSTFTIKHFTISLCACKVTHLDLLALPQLIRNQTLKNISIDLSHVTITDEVVKELVDALEETSREKQVTLTLGGIKPSQKQLKTLCRLLAHGNYPTHFILQFPKSRLTSQHIQQLCEAIETCPTNRPELTLNLSGTRLKHNAILAIAGAIMVGKLLRVNLDNTGLSHQHLVLLSTALAHNPSSEHRVLSLASNQLRAHDITSCLAALHRDHCQAHCTLDISHNPLGDAGAQSISDYLNSGHAIDGLTLNISHCQITRFGASSLIAALHSSKRPLAFHLHFEGNHVSDDCYTRLKHANDYLTEQEQDHFDRNHISHFLQALDVLYHEKTMPKLIAELKGKLHSLIADPKNYDWEIATEIVENFIKNHLAETEATGRFAHSPTVRLLFDNHLKTANMTIEQGNGEALYRLK